MRTEGERTRLGMTLDPVLYVGMSPVSIEALCGADPLVAVPHTSMCMGVGSFAERTGGPHVMWAYISL